MANDLWRLVDAEVHAALSEDGVVVDLLTTKFIAENPDEVAAASSVLARYAIAARVRRTCKKALREISEPVLPGLECLPVAVCVPDAAGGSRYVGVSRVTVAQLRAAIAAQMRQVAFDVRRLYALQGLLKRAVAAGAADDDVACRLPILRAAE